MRVLMMKARGMMGVLYHKDKKMFRFSFKYKHHLLEDPVKI